MMSSNNRENNSSIDCFMYDLQYNKITAPIYVIGIVALVSMILGHSHPLDDSWWDTWFSDLVAFIYTYHTQLYFFLGGYFLLKYAKDIDVSGYKVWFSNRLKIFLIPYFVISFISYFPKMIFMDDSIGIFEMLKNLLLYPRDGVWGHFWFIPAFLFVDLLWGLWRSYCIHSKLKCEIIFIVGGIVSAVLAVCPIRNNIFLLTDISYHAIFYFIGMLFAILPIKQAHHKKINIASALISFAILIFTYPYGNFRINTYPVINFLNGLLIIIILWNVSHLIFSNVPCSAKSFHTLPKYSFTVYLYSWPVQAVCDVILRKMHVNWIVIIFVLFLVGFAVPLFIIYFYRKLHFLHCRFFDYLFGIQTTGD